MKKQFYFIVPLALVCSLAQAAHPNPENARYTDGTTVVQLIDGEAWIDGASGKAVRLMCQTASGALEAPVKGAVSQKDSAYRIAYCAQKQSDVFVDPDSLKIVSQNRGLTEFTHYFLTQAMTTNKAALAVLAEDAVGSGTFFSVAVVTDHGKGREGSNLIALGDRIAVQTLSARDGIFTVTYRDRAPDASMADAPTLEKTQHLRLEGKQLIAINRAY